MRTTFGRIHSLLFSALEYYAGQDFNLDQSKALSSLAAIFRGRYEALYDHYPHDVLSATIPADDRAATTPMEVLECLALVDQLKKNAQFVQTASRPINIVAAARKKGERISDSLWSDRKLDSPEAKVLFDALLPPTGLSSDRLNYLLSLMEPINAFFDNNMVMADDPEVRYQRLSLADLTARILLGTGDFTKLEG